MGLIDLEQHTARVKKAIRVMENLLVTHSFDYMIVLRINPGLTSCKDLAMVGMDNN